MTGTWGAPVPPAVAYRRAGGRRRWNAQRRRVRDERRARIAELVLASERPCVATFRQGWATQLARRFGVHPTTIGRDFEAVRRTIVLPSPCCWLHAQEAEKDRQRALRLAKSRWSPLDRLIGRRL